QSIFTSFLAGVTLTALWLGPFVKPQHAIFGDWLGPFVTVNYDAISGWNTDYSLGFLGILLLFLLVVYLFMFVLFFKGLRRATIKKQKRQIGLIITGLAIAALGGTALNYLLNLFEAFKSLGDLDIIFVVIGFAIVASAYLRSPIQIYFAPVSAYRLLVMNNHGIPLLTHDFCEFGEKALIMDSSLISGALSGVISILKETLNSESTPTVIHLDDRTLLIEKTDSALYALITDSDSMVLRSALKDFGKEFEKAFKETLKDWKGMTDVFKDAYTLITEDFSFVITGEVKQEEEDEVAIIEDGFREEVDKEVIEDITEEIIDLEPEEAIEKPEEDAVEEKTEEDDLTVEEIIEDIDEALEETEEDENYTDETF
ncbi:MAG: hypothetical protein KAX09_01985, partial [Candidatus Heimdallarchaeota archaeon]|nr:hypothetical protein [Candidatus Heimdallarchaeota archaeon]MCK4289730.1 hypothetical protein [Candidatus Heimdallarchaeota archaeon]